ncbi:MAG: hypothetical protein WA350_11120 [Candidatus Sulfotelmatobacter sp.]
MPSHLPARPNRQHRPHQSSVSVRLNLQNTTQLSESFPHTTEADTNPPRPRKAPQLYLRHTLSSVLHLNPEKLLLPTHPYGGGGSSGMTMDIRQTLLHHMAIFRRSPDIVN